jgi:hypothetical protein
VRNPVAVLLETAAGALELVVAEQRAVRLLEHVGLDGEVESLTLPQGGEPLLG